VRQENRELASWSGGWAPFYELLVSEFTEDLPFYQEYAARSGGPILELACGSGRILLPLARAGYAVVGLDLFPDMLALARAKLDQEEPAVRARVELHEGDMANFDLGRKFPLIISGAGALSLNLSSAAVESCLRCMANHLAEEGLLLVDLWMNLDTAFPDPTRVVEQQIGPTVYDDPRTGGSIQITQFVTFDPSLRFIRGRNEVVLLNRNGQAVTQQEFSHVGRVPTPEELRRSFDRVGLKVVQLFRNWNRTPCQRLEEAGQFVLALA